MSRKKKSRGVATAGNGAPALAAPVASTSAHWLVVVVLCAVTCAAYANSFQSGFVVDNNALILKDPRVHVVSWENLRLILDHTFWWPQAEHGLYRPITTLSLLFNYAALGNADRPAGYHAVNLALHLANVLLVYAIGLRLVRRFWPAVGIAAVWAVHPVLTEAVTNIIGRSDELAAASVLGGLWCYLKSAEAGGRHRLAWLAGLTVATVVGVFSKESAVSLAGVIVAYEVIWWTPGRSANRLLRAAGAVAPPVLLMLYQRSIVLAQAAAPEFHFIANPLVDTSFRAGRLTAIRVMADYLWRIVWPAGLSNDYSYAQVPIASGSLHDWIGWAVVALLAAAALWQFRRQRLYCFFAAFAFVTFLPVSNLLFTTGTIMADRLLYLPSIGVIACAVLLVDAAAGWRSVRWGLPVAVAIVVSACAVRTWQRNWDWRDEASLWRAATQAAPRSHETHHGLAGALNDLDPRHANIADVIAEGDKALAILDGLPDRLNATDVYADVGLYYEELGDSLARPDVAGRLLPTPESTAAYRRSLEILLRGASIDRALSAEYVKQEVARGRREADIAPVGLPLLYERTALTHVRLGNAQQAVDSARYARQLAPLLPETHDVLTWVLTTTRRQDEAAVALVVNLLLTGDPQVMAQLRALYAGGLDTQGCAITNTPQGPTLDPSCAIARRHLCRASLDLAEIYRSNRRPDLAADVERRATTWGCAPGQ